MPRKSKLRIVDKDHGYKALMRNAARSRLGRQLSVGVISDDPDVQLHADVAEYGRGNNPERSFLRSWFDRNVRRLEDDMRAVGRAALMATERASAMRGLGEVYAREIRDRILRGLKPALAFRTLQEKVRLGVAMPEIPLVRHGALLESIGALANDEAVR